MTQQMMTAAPREHDPDRELQRRQRQHLEQVRRDNRTRLQDCRHNQCVRCVGTGIQKDGSRCVHQISCTCGRCRGR